MYQTFCCFYFSINNISSGFLWLRQINCPPETNQQKSVWLFSCPSPPNYTLKISQTIVFVINSMLSCVHNTPMNLCEHGGIFFENVPTDMEHTFHRRLFYVCPGKNAKWCLWKGTASTLEANRVLLKYTEMLAAWVIG